MRLNVPSFSWAGPSRICSSVPFWVVLTRAPRGSVEVERRHAPVEAAARRLVGARERRADHHGVGAAGDGLGDVAAVAHAAVGDHVHVVAGLEHVLRARGLDVRDRRGLGHADAEHAAVVHAAPGPTPTSTPTAPVRIRWRPVEYEAQPPTTTGTGTSRMNSLRLSGSEAVRDVLGRDDRALDDEDVEARLERGLVVGADPLRRERGGRDHALVLDLADPLRDQLLLDGLLVDALHLRRGVLLGELRDALELVVRVLVAGPDALEVEHGEAAEPADDAGGLRARRRRPSRRPGAAARSGRGPGSR